MRWRSTLGPIRQHVHAALSLGELLEKREAVRMRCGLGDGCELGEQRELWVLA